MIIKNIKKYVFICSALSMLLISQATAMESTALVNPLDFRLNHTHRVNVKVETLSELTHELRSIGDLAKDASSELQPVATTLSANHPALWDAGYQLNVQLTESFSATFMDIEHFNIQDWIRSLSVKNQAHNTDLINLSCNPADLADQLFVGANCAEHSDNNGHRYHGTKGCCQHYVRSVRIDLLDIGMRASRHSRAHAHYVTAFNGYEQKLSQLYQRYLALQHTPGIPTAVLPPYPNRPADQYVPFNFRDWLLQLAPTNNSNANVLGSLDTDNPGRLSAFVHVLARHVSCGHTTQEHTLNSWCCGHQYTRSLKIDMFTVAQALARNEDFHNSYVTQVGDFEISVKNILLNYWSLIWNRPKNTVGTSLQPISFWGQDVVKNSLQALQKAQRCREIANHISESVSNIVRQEAAGAQADTETSMRFQWFQHEHKRAIAQIEMLEDEKKLYMDTIANQSKEKEDLEKKQKDAETKSALERTTLNFQSQNIIDSIYEMVATFDPNETFETQVQVDPKEQEMNLVSVSKAVRILQSKIRVHSRTESTRRIGGAVDVSSGQDHLRHMMENIRRIAVIHGLKFQDVPEITAVLLRDRLTQIVDALTINPDSSFKQDNPRDVEDLAKTLEDILVYVTNDFDKEGTFSNLSLRQLNAETRKEILRFVHKNNLNITRIGAPEGR